MLTISVSAPNNAQGGVLKSATYPSQWVVISGNDSSSGDPALYPVTNTGLAQRSQFPKCPFKKIWVTNEDKIAYTDTVQVPTGTRVVAYIGKGIVIEDDYIYTQLGSGCFANDDGTLLHSGGQPMYLNVTGYPVTNTGTQGAIALDSSGAKTGVIAELIAIRGTTVVYRTV